MLQNPFKSSEYTAGTPVVHQCREIRDKSSKFTYYWGDLSMRVCERQRTQANSPNLTRNEQG
jgi:hypothetical protein